MDDKTLEMSLLFDFYGELLTGKQREYFDLYYNDDLSLSEIAEISGISRQGVRDMIVRAEASLRDFESKTGAVKRFNDINENVSVLISDVNRLSSLCGTEEAKKLAQKITDRLTELKG